MFAVSRRPALPSRSRSMMRGWCPRFRSSRTLVNSGRPVHGNDPALNAAVENGVQVQTRRGARIGKASDRLRNDVLVALTLAVHRATFKPQKARLVGWIS
jgi:phage terminase large subunit-like protein